MDGKDLRVARRVGTAPGERPGSCTSSGNCPDVLELESGDFAIIGTWTRLADAPEDSVILDEGGVVAVPRAVLLAAARQLREESQ